MSDPWKISQPLTTIFVHEQEKSQPAVVYDHTGQPYARPEQPFGFVDHRTP